MSSSRRGQEPGGLDEGWLFKRGHAEIRVCDGDPIREQLAEHFLWPTVHDELGDEVQVGARVEIVRDAGGNDG